MATQCQASAGDSPRVAAALTRRAAEAPDSVLSDRTSDSLHRTGLLPTRRPLTATSDRPGPLPPTRQGSRRPPASPCTTCDTSPPPCPSPRAPRSPSSPKPCGTPPSPPPPTSTATSPSKPPTTPWTPSTPHCPKPTPPPIAIHTGQPGCDHTATTRTGPGHASHCPTPPPQPPVHPAPPHPKARMRPPCDHHPAQHEEGRLLISGKTASDLRKRWSGRQDLNLRPLDSAWQQGDIADRHDRCRRSAADALPRCSITPSG
ncbi:hypothetical protein D3C57_131625 [Streptomyces rapamycinicus NRRL 5491]|uniref:Uncharacterized protein n=1 Tax=Streptomyces rapamycinicus (strain ATCC 29253 / DSM 41530 / NRRL 5491 / AYB-994) TaxID=1343740 RepID=A0A3L8R2J5_STRRN|nr:hypothetical protein D3C57_131625 [Streptomyces rapamycinicus NRRL 5491]